jgi:hypothetical protein
VDHDLPLVWLGETILLPKLPEEASAWTISLPAEGQREDSERAVQGGRYLPRQVGSYLAIAGGRSLCFDVIEVDLRIPPDPTGNEVRRMGAEISFRPPLKDVSVHWDWVNPDGLLKRLEGASLSLVPEGLGEHRVWPVIGVSGVPARRGPRPALFNSSALSIPVPPGGRVRCGAPVVFHASANPPLPGGATFEWTRTDAQGRSELVVSREGPAAIPFPAPGRYRLQVRALGNVSPPVELVAHRIDLVGPDGRPLPEASLSMLTGTSIPSEEWLLKSPERFQIAVEDSEADPPPTLAVAVRSGEGPDRLVNPPVTYALGPAKTGARRTRVLALLADPADAAVPVGGIRDDAPEDPTLLAPPRSRLEVTYRGVTAEVAGVGPMIVHEIPVRFVVVGPGFPPREALEEILDRRLGEAGAVWAPFGRRFRRLSVEVASPVQNLLMIRGRSAGVDAHGRPSRAGIRMDSVEVSVPTPWRGETGLMTPAVVARAFAQKVDPGYTVDVFEKLLASDREAVVLRIRRRDGRPAVLEPLLDGQDVSQSLTCLGADLDRGCEVSGEPGLLSLDELTLLLGLRSGSGDRMDVLLVGKIRTDARQVSRFKYYPDDAFSPPLSGAAIVSWEISDGSGRYPYALAQVLGSLLLPSGWRPRPEDSLFNPELSPAAAADAHKRVSPQTGARIRERGHGESAKNDDNPKGTDQGGR